MDVNVCMVPISRLAEVEQMPVGVVPMYCESRTFSNFDASKDVDYT